MIAPDDRGLTLGDGLFETVLALDGQLRLVAEHLARMSRGCEVLGLPAPDPELALRLMGEALAATEPGRVAVRLTLTAGSGGRGLDRPDPIAPRMLATAAAAPRPSGPARVIISTVRRNEGSPASRLKTLAYLDNVLARRGARESGADEALMLNNRGELTSATAANMFWIEDGRLYTPALDCGVLDGVMRAAVLAEAGRRGLECLEVRTAPSALAGAQAIFLTNSLIGVRPVAWLDGRPVAALRLVDELTAAASDL